LIELLQNGWTNPFELQPTDIVNLSNGVCAPKDVSEDLLNAKKKGEQAYTEFQSRLEKGVDFCKPIKKIKLQTFSNIRHAKPAAKPSESSLSSDRQLFANIILIAENRKIDMKEVFSHPLGCIPWTLANPDRTMKKTNKAALSNHLEKKVSVTEQLPEHCATVIDGMSIIQKIRGENLTFKDLSGVVLERVLSSHRCERIDVVFDVYSEQSIKELERKKRGESGGITFQEVRSGHKIINWRRLLQSSDAKYKLTKFIMDSWKEEINVCSRLNASQNLYATYGDKCIKFSPEGFHDAPELYSNQEEADTRMMIHIAHASENFENIVCLGDDTDVMILCLYVNANEDFSSKIFLKRCKSRIIEIPTLVSAIGEEMTKALVGLHAFTGCDTVSAFAGKRKVSPFNLVSKNE